MSIEKLDMKTINFTDKNIAKIAEIFPNVVSEDANGKVIDFDALKQELSPNLVEGHKERYSLNWPGKKEAQLTANTPTTKTLRPCKEESVDFQGNCRFDTTENLYIEGDNLEVLKILQESYLNKIKMIYIDPPYNTGKDFVYKDNFKRDSEEELLESGQIDEDGGRLVANLDSNGRYHSDWLSMMYPRLKLARNLLKENGVIFISIDDNEVHNLKKVCNEIFGEFNFIANIIWEKNYAPKNNNKYFSENHDHILCYTKSKSSWKRNLLPLKQSQIDMYKNPDNDSRGIWKADNFTVPGGNNKYKIETPSGDIYYPPAGRSWAYSEQKLTELIEDNKVWFGINGKNKPSYKRFLSETQNGTPPMTIWKYEEVGHTQSSKKELIKLFENKSYFETPKPVELILRMLDISTDFNTNDLILDFFSGSATTAHATMKLNSEDNGNRKFIMVQLPEITDEKSEAYKAGYKTIPEIGKERIRRAGEKIVEESGKTDLDIGFRVLKLDSSNMKDVYFNPTQLNQDNLFDTVDNIKDDRSELDLLFGVLVDWGVDLKLPITKEIIKGKTCYFVDEDSLCACFENDLDEEFIKELASRDMLRVVFRDSGFTSDDVKDNVSQIFKQLNENVDIKVI